MKENGFSVITFIKKMSNKNITRSKKKHHTLCSYLC